MSEPDTVDTDGQFAGVALPHSAIDIATELLLEIAERRGSLCDPEGAKTYKAVATAIRAASEQLKALSLPQGITAPEKEASNA